MPGNLGQDPAGGRRLLLLDDVHWRDHAAAPATQHVAEALTGGKGTKPFCSRHWWRKMSQIIDGKLPSGHP